jgi:L-threonylcarbamoyladenylate synthase
VRQGRIRVLDGGRLTPSEPSTVVDCMGTRPRVIRPGAIPAAVLRASLPTLIGDH